jgi:death-on-curing protein
MQYLSYIEALLLLFELMERLGEVRYGVFARTLIESALARPQQAAAYESAGLHRQAATLCFGLIKNHPWNGGNKRTATYLTAIFLQKNGWRLTANVSERIALVTAIEADQLTMDEIEQWYRTHSQQL